MNTQAIQSTTCTIAIHTGSQYEMNHACYTAWSIVLRFGQAD